jgi:hypothetical protein
MSSSVSDVTVNFFVGAKRHPPLPRIGAAKMQLHSLPGGQECSYRTILRGSIDVTDTLSDPHPPLRRTIYEPQIQAHPAVYCWAFQSSAGLVEVGSGAVVERSVEPPARPGQWHYLHYLRGPNLSGCRTVCGTQARV